MKCRKPTQSLERFHENCPVKLVAFQVRCILIAINGEIFDIHTYLNSRTAFLATQEQRRFWRRGFCLRGFRQERFRLPMSSKEFETIEAQKMCVKTNAIAQVVSGQTRQDEFERTLTAGQLISPFFSFCLCLLCVSSKNPKLQKQYQIELPPPENNLSFQEKKRNYQLILHLVIGRSHAQ